MELYVVRHAIAVDHGDPAYPNDDDRPLTPEGIHKFRLAARGLKEIGAKPKRIVSSPLVRARQTAEILRDMVAPNVEITISKALHPATSYADVVKEVRKYKEDVIAVVGHEPHLSGLTSYLLMGGGQAAAIEFKKGAVARILFEDGPAAGSGMLEWLIQPGALRMLAKD
ncbi:MAG: phosphohistidine phosphatase SixA [Hyphomicrobiales bacterium]